MTTKMNMSKSRMSNDNSNVINERSSDSSHHHPPVQNKHIFYAQRVMVDEDSNTSSTPHVKIPLVNNNDYSIPQPQMMLRKTFSSQKKNMFQGLATRSSEKKKEEESPIHFPRTSSTPSNICKKCSSKVNLAS